MSPGRLALILAGLGMLVLAVAMIALGGIGVTILSLIFVALATLTWAVATVLWMAHRHVPEARNLGERAVVAVRDAVVVTIGAILGLNRLAELGFPNDLLVGLLVGALLLVAAYPLAWLIQWQQGRWD